MKNMIVNGEFLETTEFSSNLYGTRLIQKKKERKKVIGIKRCKSCLSKQGYRILSLEFN